MRKLLEWLGRHAWGLLALGLGFAYFGLRLHLGLPGLQDPPLGISWLRVLSGDWAAALPGSAIDALLLQLNGQADASASLLLKALCESLLLSTGIWLLLRAFLGYGEARPPWISRSERCIPWVFFAVGLLSISLWNLAIPLPDEGAVFHPGDRSALFQRLLSGADDSLLADERLGFDAAGVRAASLLLKDPGLRSRLPFGVRAPLPLRPVRKGGFVQKDAASVASLKPTMENSQAWTPDALHGDGFFESGTMESPFPLLRLRIAGLLGDGNKLYLKTEDGRIVEPMQSRVDTRGQWRLVTLSNPGAPFRLVVESHAARPLSFTAPVEFGRAGWLAGKLLPHSLGFAVAGLVLSLISLLSCVASFGRVRSEEERNRMAAACRKLPWLALALWLFLLSFHLDTYAGSSDSSGYLNLARMFQHGQTLLPIRRPELAPLGQVEKERFVPLGFIARDETRMTPTYPPGLPLLIAGAGALMPLPWASGLCSLLHLAAFMLLTRSLARCAGLSSGWSWAAGWVAGFSPLTVFMGLQPMSDLPAAVWATAALIAAWKARERSSWALAAGACVGLAVLLRPTNVLLFAPVLLLLLSFESVGVLFRRLGLFAAGGLPMGVFLLLYNRSLYGSPFLTGYGSAGSMFSGEWVGMTLLHYARWLPVLLSPVVVFSLGFPFVRTVPPPLKRALLLWILLLGGLYAAYSCTHETWWYHRFVLPFFPALTVASLVTLRALGDKLGSRMRGLEPFRASGFAFCLMFLIWQGVRLDWMYTAEENRGYKEAVEWVEKSDPQCLVATFQASGALIHYTRLSFMDARKPENAALLIEAARRSGRPLYAIAFDFEKSLVENPASGCWRKVHETPWIKIYRWQAR
jgi:hypothetical protein